jgi:hypothetical protein
MSWNWFDILVFWTDIWRISSHYRCPDCTSESRFHEFNFDYLSVRSWILNSATHKVFLSFFFSTVHTLAMHPRSIKYRFIGIFSAPKNRERWLKYSPHNREIYHETLEIKTLSFSLLYCTVLYYIYSTQPTQIWQRALRINLIYDFFIDNKY